MKILVLMMSCRNDFFQHQAERALMTWATKRSDSVDVMYYDGLWEETEIDGNHLKVAAPDDLNHTYTKTWYALNAIRDRYDWVLRTNTSTYINIPLLEQFVEKVAKEDVLYAGELYSLSDAPCPIPIDIYARGNAILISNKMIKILIREGLNLLFMDVVDDVAIGNVLNTYYIKTDGDYLKHIAGFSHAWYHTIDNDFDCGHALSSWGCTKDMNYYNNFISIQTKMYRQRYREAENVMSLWDMMKDAPKPSLDMTLEYMTDPSIFLGSAIGYIPLSQWKKIPRDKLYNYELNHKAIDDISNPNYNRQKAEELNSVPAKNKNMYTAYGDQK